MKTNKFNRILLITLISLTIILSGITAGSLVSIISKTAYSQFTREANSATYLFRERIERFIPINLDSFSIDEERADALNLIFSDYEVHKNTADINLSDLLPVYQISPAKEQQRDSPVQSSVNLLADDGIIISSTDQQNIGVRLSLNDPDSQNSLETFLQNPTIDRLTILENEKNLWFNFYMVVPLKKGFLLIQAKHLDTQTFMRGIQSRGIDAWLHSYSHENIIQFSYPDNGTTRADDSRLSALATSRENSIVISTPYKNSFGVTVISAAIWLDSLNLGLIIERQADSIISPWYFMTGLILAVMLISFLIFFLIMMLLNKKRIEAFDHNPLTHLPGNRKIMEKLESALSSGKDLMVVYFDLDNFKAYNDLYGFSAGDEVITFSASILTRFFKPSARLFLGHIGGDDFIVIGPSDTVENCSHLFGEAFDKEILSFYSEEDQKKGYISSRNRRGEVENFPFIAMSMGGVNLKGMENVHPLHIPEICADVKKEAKKKKGSVLVLDRRKTGKV